MKAYKFLTLFSPSSFPSLVTVLASCLKTAHKSNPKIILFLKKKKKENVAEKKSCHEQEFQQRESTYFDCDDYSEAAAEAAADIKKRW